MSEKGQREFADAIEPVWMGHPFYIEVLTDIDAVFAKAARRSMELVKDDPVIDTFDEGLFSRRGMQVEELSSFLYEFTQAYGYDAQVVLRTIEIDAGFLFVGFYLQQDDLFGSAIAEDRFA